MECRHESMSCEWSGSARLFLGVVMTEGDGGMGKCKGVRGEMCTGDEEKGKERSADRVKPESILVRHAARKPRDQQPAHVDAAGRRGEHQRCVPVRIARDVAGFVPGVYEEFLQHDWDVQLCFPAFVPPSTILFPGQSFPMASRLFRDMTRKVHTYSDLQEPLPSREMQRRVASVVQVWILQRCGVVADDALYEQQIVKENRAAQADGDVDPVRQSVGEGSTQSLHSYVHRGSMVEVLVV